MISHQKRASLGGSVSMAEGWSGGVAHVRLQPASGPNLPKFLQPWSDFLVMVMVKPHFLRWNLTKASGLEAIFLFFYETYQLARLLS